MASFHADHSEIRAGLTKGVAVDLIGTATGWTSGTTFTLSGTAAAGSSILAKSFADATHYRLVIATVATETPLSLSIADSNAVSISAPITVRPFRRPKFVPSLFRR